MTMMISPCPRRYLIALRVLSFRSSAHPSRSRTTRQSTACLSSSISRSDPPREPPSYRGPTQRRGRLVPRPCSPLIRSARPRSRRGARARMECDRKLCMTWRGEASLAAGPAPAAWTRLFPPPLPVPRRDKTVGVRSNADIMVALIGDRSKLSCRTGTSSPAWPQTLACISPGVCARGRSRRPRPRNAGLVHEHPTRGAAGARCKNVATDARII